MERSPVTRVAGRDGDGSGGCGEAGASRYGLSGVPGAARLRALPTPRRYRPGEARPGPMRAVKPEGRAALAAPSPSRSPPGALPPLAPP